MPVDDEDEIGRRLEELPSIEPPSELRASIMSVVGATPAGSAPMPARRPRRLTFAFGWAAAAGIILIFLFIAQPQISGPTVATMAPPPFSQSYAGPELDVTIRRSGDLLLIEPVMKSDGPLTITVRWDPESVALAGVSGAPDASSQTNQTTFLLQGDRRRAAVSLGVHPAARSTELRVLVDGEEILRTDVNL